MIHSPATSAPPPYAKSTQLGLKTLVAIASALLVMLVAIPAIAQAPALDLTDPAESKRKEASQRFQKGVGLYQAGDIRAALIEFKRAYKLAPTYQLLFNIGQASAELNEYVDAHNSFTQYIRDGGSKIKAKRRAMVEREIARLKTYLATLLLNIAIEGAEVTIDDVVVGVSPLPGPVLVGAGRRKVLVTASGYARWERRVDLAGEDSESIEVNLLSLGSNSSSNSSSLPIVPNPVGRPVENERPSRGLGAGFWAGAATTVVLGVGTGAAAVLTMRAQADYDDELKKAPNTEARLEAANDKLKRMALITDVGIGLTAAAGIVTIVLAIRGAGANEAPRSQSSLAVGVAPNQIAISGRF